MDQSSNLDAIANDQQIPIAACAGESISKSISEHISNQSKVLTIFLFSLEVNNTEFHPNNT
jgi:hypothetical protein